MADQDTKVTFPLHNKGGRTLRIYEVHADCGCTTVEYPQLVKPGETVQLRGVFHPASVWSGKLEKGLTVRTNDPRSPETRLTFFADVIPLIRMTPQSPFVLNFQRGEVYHQTFKLTPRGGRPVRISVPKSDNPLVKAELGQPHDEGGEWTYPLYLTLGPQNQPGDFSARVLMDTTDARISVLPLTVVGFAKTGPVATPTTLAPPAFTPHEGSEVTRFQVFTRKGKLKLNGVETGDPALEAEIIPRTPDQFYEVALKYRGGWKDGSVSRTVRVKTDDPSAPILSIPFSVTVVAPAAPKG